MPPRCSICAHSDREAIDRALVDGGTLRAIARQFRVGRDAIRRHRHNGHVSTSLAKAHEVAEVAKADDLLARVGELESRALRILDRAERAGELRTALQAIRELRSMVELLFDTERRRNADESISGESLMIMMAGVADVIRRHVPDRDVRARMADEIRLLTEPGVTEKEDGDV